MSPQPAADPFALSLSAHRRARGTVDAISTQAVAMHLGASMTLGNQVDSFGGCVPMVSAQLTNSPEMSRAIQQVQQQMLETPR